MSGGSGRGKTTKGSFSFRVIMLGEANSGKSSLLVRLTEKTFSDERVPTVNQYSKVHHMIVDETPIQLSIIDGFNEARRKQLRGAHGLLIVFDVNSLNSFEIAVEKYAMVKEYASKTVNSILVAAKTDLSPGNRAVVEEDIQRFFREKGEIPYMETSSKWDSNVQELFSSLARLMKDQMVGRGPAQKLENIPPCAHCRSKATTCWENCLFYKVYPLNRNDEYTLVSNHLRAGGASGKRKFEKLINECTRDDISLLCESLEWEARLRKDDPVGGAFQRFTELEEENYHLKEEVEDMKNTLALYEQAINRCIESECQLCLSERSS